MVAGKIFAGAAKVTRPSPTTDPKPLDAARAALAESWTKAGRPPVIVLAVSGGGDSMALLAAADALAGRAIVRVTTVDHGLRPSSALEARAVGAACAGAGLSHEILKRPGDPILSGLQAAARAARYRLLAGHAAETGAGSIALAHSEDDLAETYLMRLDRGSGARGLASMLIPIAVASGAGEPVAVLRPFLGLRRATLRAAAIEAGLHVFDDPSNEDAAFERVRVRRFLTRAATDAGEAGFALSVPSIAASARRLARAARLEADFIGERAKALRLSFGEIGFAQFEWRDVQPAQDTGFLARVVHAASGSTYAPSEASVCTAFEGLRAGASASVGGAIVAVRSRGRAGPSICLVHREPAALFGRAGVVAADPAPIGPESAIVWDRRFIVRNPSGSPGEVKPVAAGADIKSSSASSPQKDSVRTAPAIELPNGVRLTPDQHPAAFEFLGRERFRGEVVRF